uniref:Uncharacterized protein n=1 Tax=Eutreptiella gymnastica TaxID=73025 RepID=A0A7S1IDI9_9EUGL|mmetsp:Transcript_148553/g.259647  ORF Transcript_148553/g.259647 Transcript_148553/m.259647 type:complete len:101 (+) Transcript_148553:218-520(+)
MKEDLAPKEWLLCQPVSGACTDEEPTEHFFHEVRIGLVCTTPGYLLLLYKYLKPRTPTHQPLHELCTLTQTELSHLMPQNYPEQAHLICASSAVAFHHLH